MNGKQTRGGRLRSHLMLTLTAFIWGTTFVAQSVGLDYVDVFTFNMARFLLGGLVLTPVVLFLLQKEKSAGGPDAGESGRQRIRDSIKGGLLCGLVLFAASSFQQLGISMTTVSKGGFITALYIVLVPVFGIFLKKKVQPAVWVSVAMATAGMYLLCITEGFHINLGDFYIFLCAVFYAFHILVIDRVSPGANGVLVSCVQFFVSGLLAAVLAFLFEEPDLANLAAAWQPVLYAGFLSCGVAYTFQILAQQNTDPTVASLIMSMESVFSLLAGWVILGQGLSAREGAGCLLVFAAVLLAQAPDKKKG